MDIFPLKKDTITKRRCPHKPLYVSTTYIDGDTWTACLEYRGYRIKEKWAIELAQTTPRCCGVLRLEPQPAVSLLSKFNRQKKKYGDAEIARKILAGDTPSKVSKVSL